jgi:hypothetical protein
MTEYLRKCEQIAAALADFFQRHGANKKARDEIKQERILAEIEAVRKLGLSRETLIIECATRKIEHELAAEAIRDYMDAINIIGNAADISGPMAGPYSGEQSQLGSRLRGRVTEDGKTISDIIDRLSLEKNELGEYVAAAELWGRLHSELEMAGANPKEIRNSGKPRKTSYNYITDTGKFRSIQRDTFEDKILQCRNKKMGGSGAL